MNIIDNETSTLFMLNWKSICSIAGGALFALFFTSACSLKWQSSDTFDREMSMIETVQKQAGVVDLDSYTKREKRQLDAMIDTPEMKRAMWEK